MNKTITELSNEELEELVSNAALKAGENYLESNNDIEEFLSVFKIKSGENLVTSKLLHNLYKKWSIEPLTIRKFSAELDELFSRKNEKFLINKTTNELKFKKKVLSAKKYKIVKIEDITLSKHFQNYLNYYNIKPGKLYIKDIVLYNLYDKWIYPKRKHNPLNQLRFNQFCRLFFKHKRIKRHDWFRIEETIKEHLNSNLIELMKK